MPGLGAGDGEGRSTMTSWEPSAKFILVAFFKQNHAQP